MQRHTAGVAVAAALLAGAAVADEGRFPIFEPTVIAQPGSYVLTRDVSANTTVLSILADGVTVDINGFTIDCTNPQLPAVLVAGTAGADKGVTIRDGRVSGGLYGIHGAAGVRRRIEVRNVDVESAASVGILIEEPNGVVLADGSVRKGLIGIQLGPLGSTKLGPGSCTVGSATIRGYLSADHSSDLWCACTRCWLVDMRVALPPIGPDPDPTGRIRIVDGPGSVIRGLEMAWGDPSPQPNIVFERSPGSLVERIVLNGPTGAVQGGHGILADSSSSDLRVVGSVLSGLGGDGIQILGSGAQIYDNLINRNGGNGVTLFGQNALVDANKMWGNAGAGIFFGPNAALHAFRGNMLRGNNGGSVGGKLQGGDDVGGNIP